MQTITTQNQIAYRYVAERCPIDIFTGTITAKKLAKKYAKRMLRYPRAIAHNQRCLYTEDLINLIKAVDFVKTITKQISNEIPHTILFFATPSLSCGSDCVMQLHALAKIDNNGTTYVFTNEKSLAQLTTNHNEIWEIIEE